MTSPAASSALPSPKPAVPKTFWQSVVRFDRSKVLTWVAVRNALGVALPLAVGVAIGSVGGGLAVATGALNASYSDSPAPYPQRLRRMLTASLLIAITVTVGGLCGPHRILAVLAAAIWAFGAGMLVAVSSNAGDLGVLGLVILLVYSGIELDPRQAVYAGPLALCGGLLQTLLALSLWPLRRYVPERRALGELFAELAREAGAPIHATNAPPASGRATQAQDALRTLDRDHSVDAERYRSLLSQAERIRLGLLLLARLRTRIGRDFPSSAGGEVLDLYFKICSRALDAIGASLLARGQSRTMVEFPEELDEMAESLRDEDLDPPALLAMARDARFQMDAMNGQLRSAIDLLAAVTPEGQEAFARREASRPWTLRLSGIVAILRANLNLQSAVCRHAIRLAALVALGDAIGRFVEFRRGYWLPMTIAILLKPDFATTFTRGVLRLAGTYLSLAFATALFHLLTPGLRMQVILIAICMFLLRCLGPANYGLFAIFVTALIVFLIAMTGLAPKDVMIARAVNTTLGGIIALAGYWLWPTWERTQAPETLAGMLDAYRDYFRMVRDSYLAPGKSYDAELDRARQAGRLARSNVEASMDRLSTEPGTSPDLVKVLSGMLASSHRFVHAAMALEAGLSSTQPVPARPGFRKFADDVDFTLYYLAAALRGSPLTREQLPDLREDYHALIHSGQSSDEGYQLVNVEIDRITNSLNTLAEQVMLWAGGPSRVSEIAASGSVSGSR